MIDKQNKNCLSLIKLDDQEMRYFISLSLSRLLYKTLRKFDVHSLCANLEPLECLEHYSLKLTGNVIFFQQAIRIGICMRGNLN